MMSEKIARWYITDDCNFTCKYCYFPEELRGIETSSLDFETVRNEIVPKLVRGGISEINFLGGEPTIYPHLIELIELLRENDIWVGLVTNGSMLTEE